MGLNRPVLTIATVNVNGIRAAFRRGMGDWLAERRPDVLLLHAVAPSLIFTYFNMDDPQLGGLSPDQRREFGAQCGEFSDFALQRVKVVPGFG